MKKYLPIIIILIVLLNCFLSCESIEETIPDPYADSIIFYGDTRDSSRIHEQITENIISLNPKAVFHLGDAVSDGEDPDQWSEFNLISQPLRQITAFYPVIGNHEKGVDPAWYISNWEVSIGQGYYSLDLLSNGDLVQVPIDINGQSSYENVVKEDVLVHFAVLHSNPGFLEYGEEQFNWLVNDLTEYLGLPVILVFHIPLYCAGVHSEEMSDEHPADILYDILDTEGLNVIACINGHDHAFERFQVNNTKHIVTGCAGEDLIEIQQPEHPYLEKYILSYHYTVMLVKNDPAGGAQFLEFTVFDEDSDIIDQFNINF